MSDGQHTAVAVSSAGIPKGLNDHGMAPMPRFFYRLMLGSEYEQESVMGHVQTGILEAATGFVQDPELKRKMYNSIRRGVFTKGGQHSQSMIVNELTGMYGFVKKAIKYGMFTAKMYMDK